MKHYFFNDGTEEEKYGHVLRDAEHGIEITVLAGSPMSLATANKVAALGQPVVLQGNCWSEGMAEAAQNLLDNSADSVVVSFDVSMNNIETLEEVLSIIEGNPKLFGIKVRLTENEVYTDAEPLDDDRWNILIVRCYDHNIELCWTGDAASYRYSAYLESVGE